MRPTSGVRRSTFFSSAFIIPAACSVMPYRNYQANVKMGRGIQILMFTVNLGYGLPRALLVQVLCGNFARVPCCDAFPIHFGGGCKMWKLLQINIHVFFCLLFSYLFFKGSSHCKWSVHLLFSHYGAGIR